MKDVKVGEAEVQLMHSCLHAASYEAAAEALTVLLDVQM